MTKNYKTIRNAQNIVLILLVIIFSLPSYCQTGCLKVTVIDASNGETIPFAALVVMKENVQKAKGQSDINGDIKLQNLGEGKFVILITYLGYVGVEMSNVPLIDLKTTYVEVKLRPSYKIAQDFDKVQYKAMSLDCKKRFDISEANQIQPKVSGSGVVWCVCWNI